MMRQGRFSYFLRERVLGVQAQHGVYQHCGEAHLHRYLAEFDFRYKRRSAFGIGDQERHDMLLAAIRGKRLTYRRIGEARHA